MKLTQLNGSEYPGIKGTWLIDLNSDKAGKGYYRFPDNYAEIIIILKGSCSRMVIGTKKKTLLTSGNIYLEPVKSRGTILVAEEDSSLLLIKVEPNLQFALLSKALFDSNDEIKPVEFSGLEDLWQFNYEKIEVTYRVVVQFINAQFASASTPDSVVSQCMNLMRQMNGAIKIKDLNERVGVSKSTLEDKFNKELGISPKEFCKIEKINYFLSKFDRYKNEKTLTQLTFDSGYYDQSHLIKEFKYFVNMSPRKYLNETQQLRFLNS